MCKGKSFFLYLKILFQNSFFLFLSDICTTFFIYKNIIILTINILPYLWNNFICYFWSMFKQIWAHLIIPYLAIRAKYCLKHPYMAIHFNHKRQWGKKVGVKPFSNMQREFSAIKDAKSFW